MKNSKYIHAYVEYKANIRYIHINGRVANSNKIKVAPILEFSRGLSKKHRSLLFQVFF